MRNKILLLAFILVAAAIGLFIFNLLTTKKPPVLTTDGQNKSSFPVTLPKTDDSKTTTNNSSVSNPPAITQKALQYKEFENVDFKMSLPTTFYQNKTINGTYAHSYAFSTKPGDDPEMAKEDAGLSINIANRGSGSSFSSLDQVKKELAQAKSDLRHYLISQEKDLAVAGLPAYQYLQETLEGIDSSAGCYFKTYVQQGSVVHDISMSADSCEIMLQYKDAYDHMLGSFEFAK